MKTAMQEVILKMKEAKVSFPNVGFDEEFIRGFNKAFQMAIFITEKVGTEKEKQQIIDSYLQGFCHCEYEGIMDAQKYYKETFDNK